MNIEKKMTLKNPDAFDSVPELRRELHQANETLLKYACALNERDELGSALSGLIHRLLCQHLRDDYRGVASLLDAHLNARPKLREAIEEANEAGEIDQVQRWRASQESRPMPPYNASNVEPWALSSVNELRKALDVANRTGMSLVAALDNAEAALTSIARDMAAIVAAHLRNDKDGVSQTASEFAGRHAIATRRH
ncbi:hypothetical protein AB3X91_30760 [Paraburkholderia sp. BR14263]|uniref:hypothetical protein n=1 Tax=unclassified Paraburkholderia TaxID=2615204 RepID=UPI0034D0032A